MSQWVIDVGDQDFETAVVARSAQTPVVVDFWAPWCAPCRSLGPLLERLADEYGGEFVLAKVNVDENPGLAQALNIGSIPMVLGFRDGQVVGEFVGALAEGGVREFLTTVLPGEADHWAATGDQLLGEHRTAEAEEWFRKAIARDPRCARALLGLARILAEGQEHRDALQLLDRIGPGPARQEADRLAAEIRIRDASGGDEQTLRASLAADPSDLTTRLRLGQVLAASSRYAEALAEYLEIVRRDRHFEDGAARKAMLDIFDLLGAGDETVEHYRSELAKELFR
jgi:putative thioredoxin